MISAGEEQYLRRAIDLALEAEQAGNLPIGAVLTLDGAVIAEGKNAIWHPHFSGTRHAEIEALRAAPPASWSRASAMTLYTTLEPCLMCTGAILLHHIGRVIFGAQDTLGGGRCVFGHMPPFHERELTHTQWIGPALPQPCDDLFSRALALIADRQAAGLIV